MEERKLDKLKKLRNNLANLLTNVLNSFQTAEVDLNEAGPRPDEIATYNDYLERIKELCTDSDYIQALEPINHNVQGLDFKTSAQALLGLLDIEIRRAEEEE